MGKLYNYETEEYEEVESLETDEQARRYLPDLPEAQSLFTLHRFHGASLVVALALVTEASMANVVSLHKQAMSITRKVM